MARFALQRLLTHGVDAGRSFILSVFLLLATPPGDFAERYVFDCANLERSYF